MGLTGWVKNHREILDHWVSQEPHMFALWQRLILEANHQETKKMFNGTLTTVMRGELVFGLEAWEAKTGISKKILRRCLKTLEYEGMVGRKRTNKCSIISIINYDKYQSTGSQEAGEGQAEGKQRASKGQHRKNVKNGENVEKKDIESGASIEASEPAIGFIPTNKYNTEGEEYPVTQKQIDDWQAIYPAVNVLQEVKKAKAWLQANPAKAKTYKGMARFLNGWMSRQQDKCGSMPSQQGQRRGSGHKDFPFEG
jgi:hypothetical protein